VEEKRGRSERKWTKDERYKEMEDKKLKHTYGIHQDEGTGTCVAVVFPQREDITFGGQECLWISD
jgi:hypothetical protein